MRVVTLRLAKSLLRGSVSPETKRGGWTVGGVRFYSVFIQGTERSPVGEVPKRSRTETPPPGASRLKFSREQRTGRKCLDRTMANGKCGGGLKRPAIPSRWRRGWAPLPAPGSHRPCPLSP